MWTYHFCSTKYSIGLPLEFLEKADILTKTIKILCVVYKYNPFYLIINNKKFTQLQLLIITPTYTWGGI